MHTYDACLSIEAHSQMTDLCFYKWHSGPLILVFYSDFSLCLFFLSHFNLKYFSLVFVDLCYVISILKFETCYCCCGFFFFLSFSFSYRIQVIIVDDMHRWHFPNCQNDAFNRFIIDSFAVITHYNLVMCTSPLFSLLSSSSRHRKLINWCPIWKSFTNLFLFESNKLNAKYIFMFHLRVLIYIFIGFRWITLWMMVHA